MVIMGLVLVLLETVMTLLVSTLVIGGLLKPINPKGICPKTHYRKPWFVMFVIVFLVETINFFCDGFFVFLVLMFSVAT